jgi:hypothetical protein
MGPNFPKTPKIGPVKEKFQPKRKRRLTSEWKKIDPQFKNSASARLIVLRRHFRSATPLAALDRIMSPKIVIKFSLARHRLKFEGTA